ncbi:MAG: phage holin family protein [Anaerobacillus sp.]|uniref:phage holin family protein n=1 Tax=Anaerobacillus sp. TaxID=1872506 RepID=UPI00391CBC28
MLTEMLSQVEISEQLAIVVPALMIIGYALKRTPKIADWMIVWILLVIGVIASGFTLGFTISGVGNGIIAAGAAITTHQAYKQTKNRDKAELIREIVDDKLKNIDENMSRKKDKKRN